MTQCIRLLTLVVATCFVACAIASLKAQPPTAISNSGSCRSDDCENKHIVCRTVSETKPIKKVVYESKRVPYCMHCLSGHHCRNGHCQRCEGAARWKTVLVKREITCGEKTELKCVTEELPCGSPTCPQCGSHPHVDKPTPTPVPAAKLPPTTSPDQVDSPPSKPLKP